MLGDGDGRRSVDRLPVTAHSDGDGASVVLGARRTQPSTRTGGDRTDCGHCFRPCAPGTLSRAGAPALAELLAPEGPDLAVGLPFARKFHTHVRWRNSSKTASGRDRGTPESKVSATLTRRPARTRLPPAALPPSRQCAINGVAQHPRRARATQYLAVDHERPGAETERARRVRRQSDACWAARRP